MILQKNIYQSKWDSGLTEYDLNSTHLNAIQGFIEQANIAGRTPVHNVNSEIILGKLGLVKNNKLSYAAWHLFCDDQPIELQLAVFRGVDKSGFADIRNVKGNLFYLLEMAESYVTEKINWRTEFRDDMKRHELPEIPIGALREAIVNSFVHRNFNDPKGNEIAVFTNRIEIYNPGTFPEGLTPEDYINGHERSFLRNPKIAEMFYYTRDIDRWGSGFQRMNKECEEQNIQLTFEVMVNGFLSIFYRPVEKSDKIFSRDKGGIEGGIEGGMKSIVLSGDLLQLPDRQKDVLLLIVKNNRITISESAKQLGVNRSAIQKHFNALINKKIIERVGSKKGGSWKINQK